MKQEELRLEQLRQASSAAASNDSENPEDQAPVPLRHPSTWLTLKEVVAAITTITQRQGGARHQWVHQDPFKRRIVRGIVPTVLNTDVFVNAQDVEQSGASQGLHPTKEPAIAPRAWHRIENHRFNAKVLVRTVHHLPLGHVNRNTGHRQLLRQLLTQISPGRTTLPGRL